MYSTEIENIIQWFEGDTIKFIDDVLSNNQTHPEYSAVTCSNRIIILIKVNKEYSEKYKSIEEFLADIGYDEKCINIFMIRKNKESKYYHGEILTL